MRVEHTNEQVPLHESTDPLTFAELRSVSAKRSVEDFDHQPADWSLAEYAGKLAEETGEVAQVCTRVLYGKPLDVEALADELGDVVVCADLLATAAGIDLGAAVRRKFNKTSTKRKAANTLPEALPVANEYSTE